MKQCKRKAKQFSFSYMRLLCDATVPVICGDSEVKTFHTPQNVFTFKPQGIIKQHKQLGGESNCLILSRCPNTCPDYLMHHLKALWCAFNPISATNFTLRDDKPQAAYIQLRFVFTMNLLKLGFGEHKPNEISLILHIHYMTKSL